MTSWQPKDPAFRARVQAEFAQQAFMGTIGARLTDVGPGMAEIRMPFGLPLTQRPETVHGGVLAALAETAGVCAASTLMSAGDSAVAVEYKISHLGSAKACEFVAKAVVMRPGRSLTIVRTDIYGIAGDTEELCAMAVVTLARAARRCDSCGK